MEFFRVKFTAMKKRFLYLVLRVFIVIMLTILTQVGGLVYLLYLWIKQKHSFIGWKRRVLNIGLFVLLYSICSFAIVPTVAYKLYNRKALPITNSALQPLRMYTFLMNRHYVDEELYEVLVNSAETMQLTYPETTTYFLDACFPLGAKFPLLPHWSHNDGRKVDLAFYYKDSETGIYKNGSPSWLGYGVCESPKAGDKDMPTFCKEQGFFQYSMLEKIVPQYKKETYHFDAKRTKKLIEILTASPSIKKLFIKPHLQSRMQLTSPKIRFHGCHAVRHDDHIHVQL